MALNNKQGLILHEQPTNQLPIFARLKNPKEFFLCFEEALILFPTCWFSDLFTGMPYIIPLNHILFQKEILTLFLDCKSYSKKKKSRMNNKLTLVIVKNPEV